MFTGVLDGKAESEACRSFIDGEKVFKGQLKLNWDCGGTKLVGFGCFAKSTIVVASALEFVGTGTGYGSTRGNFGIGGATALGCGANRGSSTRREFALSTEDVDSSSSELVDSSGASARFSLCVSFAS